MWTVFRIFVASTLCLTFAANGFCLESRRYKAPKESSEVVAVWNHMDQTIECRGDVDKLSLVSPPQDPESRSWVRREDYNRRPLLFTRAQIAELLQTDQHRSLLVITIRGERDSDGKFDQMVKELEKFAADFYYKRVLIIGWPDWNSIYVYRDTQDDTLKLEQGPAEKAEKCRSKDLIR